MHRFKTAAAALIAVSGCFCPLMHGQEPATQQPLLTLPSTSDLARLLDLAALRLNLHIDYDPANPLLKGQQVTLRTGGLNGGGGAMSDEELWATTSRLLVQRGLTTVRGPESITLTVVKLDDAQRLARMEQEIDAGQRRIGGESNPNLVAGYVNQPVRLNHVSLKEATEAVRIFQRSAGSNQATTANVGPATASTGDLLVLSDTSPRVHEQLRLLAKLDTADNATVVRSISVTNVSPVQAAASVMQLATKREAVSGEKLPGEVVAGGTGSQGEGSRAGSVMIIAPRRVIERWQQLIALADSRESVTTQTYAPRLFSVKEVASLIQQIAGSVTAAGGGDDRFKVVTEDPTGSLIVTATPTQHEKIAALMERLDSVPGESRRPVRSFVVRNRPVDKFVAMLQGLISAGVLDGASDLSGIGGGGGASSSPSAGPPNGLSVTPPPMTSVLPASMSPLVPTQPGLPNQTLAVKPATRPGSGQTLPLTLTADETTNTIIAVGDGRLLDQLDALIKTLDVRQPQVMLEAIIVSLNDNDKTELGVELQQLSYSNNMLTRLSSIFGLGPSLGEVGTGVPVEGRTGGSAIVLDPGDYAVVVRALQTVKQGRTVSTSKLLVSNNEEATLNAVKQIPFTASFTAGNASTPTTSYGGSQDAGTQLTIRPQISDGHGLLLDYNISISQFGDVSGNPNLPPERDVTSVQSLATIPDGYAIVVTGLELNSEVQDEQRVPFLGELPVIGNLFKSQTDGKTRSRFFVFIRASVMRDQSLESLRYVSDVDASAAMLPTSWPKSTPQVVR